MYYSQKVAERIKSQARKKEVLVKEMLSACDLNVNTLSQISDKKGISSFSLAKIADYLDCSVDYLLGRTDVPDSHKNLPPNICEKNDKQLKKIEEIYEELDEVGRARLLVAADEIAKGEKEK